MGDEADYLEEYCIDDYFDNEPDSYYERKKYEQEYMITTELTTEPLIILNWIRDYTNATAIVQGDAVEPANNVILTVNLKDFIFVLDEAITMLENR